MRACGKSPNFQPLIWPAVGLVLGAALAMNPFQWPHLSLAAGIVAWCVAMLVVFGLAANPLGARVGAVATGLFIAIPCLVDASPWARCLLICFMAIPLVAAAAFVSAPPIPTFMGRFRYFCSWFGTRTIDRQPRRLDLTAVRTLLLATAALAAALALVEATPHAGPWLSLRWFAGGIAIFAVAEMATASLSLAGAVFGVTVPRLFHSPYLSKSVNEFWTKRWNIPTAEFFRRYAFAPIARQSVGWALVATFASAPPVTSCSRIWRLSNGEFHSSAARSSCCNRC